MSKPKALVLLALLCFALGVFVGLKSPEFFDGLIQKPSPAPVPPIHTLPEPPRTQPYEKTTVQGVTLYVTPTCGAEKP